MTGKALLLLLLAALGAVSDPAAAAGPAPPVVGLVPSESEEITRSLAEGARLGLEQLGGSGGPELELVVGRPARAWETASAAIVELAHGREVRALIAPPDRAIAHLAAQVGTRSQVPVISTSCFESVTATGSGWVISAVEGCPPAPASPAELPVPAFDPAAPASAAFAAAYRARWGREPDAWAAAGHAAALTLRDLPGRLPGG